MLWRRGLCCLIKQKTLKRLLSWAIIATILFLGLSFHSPQTTAQDGYKEVYLHPVPTEQSETLLNSAISYYALQYEVSETLAREIMRCESGLKPNAINHNKRNGEVWSSDYSYWQINDYYHAERFKKIGWDITNPEDNLEAGFYLLATEGSGHWSASRHCWN